MEAYAVVATGGKQYKVKAGDSLNVELLSAEPGERIQLSPVLAVSDGNVLRVGTPEIPETKVTALVVKHIRGVKVISYKKKRRKGSSRKKGHRQELTVLKVENIA